MKSGGINYAMMWFSGSGQPGIFQIFMMGYCIMGQLSLFRNASQTFKPVEMIAAKRECSFFESPFKAQRIVYLLLCVGGFLYVGHTASKQGILPFKASDYLPLIPRRRVVEHVALSL